MAGKKGKRISGTATSAKFEVPALVTAETLAEFPSLAKVEKVKKFTTFADTG